VNCGLCERDLYGRAAKAYLCPACTEGTAERLAEFPDIFEKLEEMLLPEARSEARGPRSVFPPALVVLEVADLRGVVTKTLGSWHRALFDALQWDAPPLIEDPTERVASGAKALLRNITWIAGSWPAAADFAWEIRDLHKDVSSVIRPDDRGTRMGLCPTLIDGVLCGAPLRLPRGAKVAECDWCSSTYAPNLWPALRLAQQEAFRPRAESRGTAA
jgi:hypothetical protein